MHQHSNALEKTTEFASEYLYKVYLLAVYYLFLS